jgi:hypothetical protein
MPFIDKITAMLTICSFKYSSETFKTHKIFKEKERRENRMN